FQAEDGIRDGHVTGVQTCALPICRRVERKTRHTAQPRGGTPDVDFSVLPDDGHASRVIAAVFQALEPVENQRHNFFWSDVPDYPTHGCLSLVLCKWSLAKASAKRFRVAHSRDRN